ncbi:MAG TPA: cbb3-type cytochrome c oxidase subunit I, partial [Alphaproteobacteria bacterium]|nr:cbb3-type cytochrome c oxidase subunit I [Alphaproteobacteria bacterium]
MADRPHASEDVLSSWWKLASVIAMAAGFAVLILITVKAYENAPPIPARVVDPGGAVVFTGADIAHGQEVFLKYGLMDNGTIWGHGAYLGPDFSAQYLHNWALDLAEQNARTQFHRGYGDLSPAEKAAVDGVVALSLKQNRYDPAAGTLAFSATDAQSFTRQVGAWMKYFAVPAENGGLKARLITDPTELRHLTAFFAWTAWASAAERPGETYSYTSNFPYEPLAGNHPTAGAVLYSGISLVFLLGGTGLVLLAFGRFQTLGWHRKDGGPPHTPAIATTDEQRATLKFMAVAALLFFGQTLIGGGTAHYRAEPGDFYGFDLSAIFPSNLLRTWHLQLAILWIATAYVGGALFVAAMLGRSAPPGQRRAINVLFGAIVVVALGSLLGEWIGLQQWLGSLWFWLGNQGWEYLEIGRAWQVLLAVGLVFWFWLVWRQVAPVRHDPERRELVYLFLIAAAAIPIFYLPALFFGSATHYTVVDTWRFWIIHLWVEGFFELFVTVIVAIIFHELDLVSRTTALRAVYLDIILIFGGGLIGTGHHWYFTGQSQLNMALSSAFSALEVVPLTLLTLDAWGFVRVTRVETGAPIRHQWAVYFLMAVGFWNFTGAGIFGFLINMPIVSYFEAGTNLTPNHGHAAMMGVFGMLGVALMVFILREITDEATWASLRKYVRCAFFGLNIGLAMMIVLSLFPGGVLQMYDVVEHGYWHARSLAYSSGAMPRLIEWLRLPGDLVFIVFGSLPILIAMGLGYLSLWNRRERGGALRPA